MFVIGFSGANAMPQWILFSGMTLFSVTKADWNYSQQGENTFAGNRDQDIIRNIRQRLWSLEGKVSWFEAPWKQMAPEFSFSVRIAWILLDMRRFWRKDCYQSMRHTISFNRTMHHAVNSKLSLLFWTRPWSACLLIGRSVTGSEYNWAVVVLIETLGFQLQTI